MKIIHSGFDTIEFAVQGALSTRALNQLENAKAQAIKQDCEISITCVSGSRKATLLSKGMTGGYAYVLNMGPLDQLIRFKSNPDKNQWNGFVTIRAASLAAYGWREAVDRAMQSLTDTGFMITGISLNRADYCMDFLHVELDLDPKNFIAHSRVTKTTRGYLNETSVPLNHVAMSGSAQSDMWKSITIGKMPGRQVIIYDKRPFCFYFRCWSIFFDRVFACHLSCR